MGKIWIKPFVCKTIDILFRENLVIDKLMQLSLENSVLTSFFKKRKESGGDFS
jgi:hypothetical protein